VLLRRGGEELVRVDCHDGREGCVKKAGKACLSPYEIVFEKEDESLRAADRNTWLSSRTGYVVMLVRCQNPSPPWREVKT
jgi:hypothetical protein